MEPLVQTTQKVSLAGVLNAPEENRDSAYYSSTDASSKHTSTASCVGVNVLGVPGTVLHSSHPSQPDKTPSPINTTNLVPQSLVSPSTSNMSVASMVSPTTPGSADLRRFERPQSLDSAPSGAPMGLGEVEPISRRESVDSRINQGFGEMKLGSSPYATHNQSASSLHSTFQQQRNPRPGIDSLAMHRISNGYQPSAERNPDGHPKTVRTAPAITGPATSQIARAAEPTKGQAWAFPEEEIHRVPSTASQSLIDSRRSSVAESFASSQFTTESRLPPGQRRLDDGLGGADYPTTHHHALQHKQLADLQSETPGSQAASQPYSRTPELRVSHKLAERKRRTEMKELFEQLKDLMPQERGSKASKWEILTKAISEHQRLQETVRVLQTHCQNYQSDVDMLKSESHGLRMEIRQLQATLASMSANRAPGHQGPQPALPGVYVQGPPRQELPPLRSLSGSLPGGPESMTGVQYEQPRNNGYP